SPAALALVVSAFPEGVSRNKAMGLYAAIASGGASLGLVLGGLITQWESWRWAFFINVPVGIAVAACTPFFLTETPRRPGHFDLAGALTSVTGMAALVYAFIRAASDGWSDRMTLAGMVPVIVGMAWLSRISPGSAYLPGVLGPMILFGLGMGLAMVPLTTAALAGVRAEDSGAASSMVNVTQQVGGALGLAILVTV